MNYYRITKIGLMIAVLMLNLGCSTYNKFITSEIKVENELQEILDNAVNKYQLPGVQASVLFSDGTMLNASSGTVDFERKEAEITNQSIFRIGSTTKMFVAALICRQIEKGQLSFDDTIDKWFPSLPNTNTITIRQLLNQTSGVKENLFTKPSLLLKSSFNKKKQWNPNEVIHKLMKNMVIVPVKERKFLYANNNYILLGLIAEKVGNNNIASLLSNEFFIPLNMKNTYFLPTKDDSPEYLIKGYDEYIPFGQHEIKATNKSWSSLMFSAGAMASTSHDLSIWINAFFHGQVVKPNTLKFMRTYLDAGNNGRDNNIVGYGLGLAQYELETYKMEGHPGGGFGGECFPFYLPEKDVTIVVSYNLSRKDNPAGKALIVKIINELVD